MEEMREGTLKWVIQEVKRAVEQDLAVMSSRGTASTQQVEQLMIVKNVNCGCEQNGGRGWEWQEPRDGHGGGFLSIGSGGICGTRW